MNAAAAVQYRDTAVMRIPPRIATIAVQYDGACCVSPKRLRELSDVDAVVYDSDVAVVSERGGSDADGCDANPRLSWRCDGWLDVGMRSAIRDGMNAKQNTAKQNAQMCAASSFVGQTVRFSSKEGSVIVGVVSNWFCNTKAIGCIGMSVDAKCIIVVAGKTYHRKPSNLTVV